MESRGSIIEEELEYYAHSTPEDEGHSYHIKKSKNDYTWFVTQAIASSEHWALSMRNYNAAGLYFLTL